MKRLETLTIAALTSSSSSVAGSTHGISHGCHNTVEKILIQPQPLLAPEEPANPAHPLSFADEHRHQLDRRHNAVHRSLNDTVLPPDLFPLVHALYTSITPQERRTYHIITTRERFSIRDVIKYGLIKLGYAMHPNLFESAKHASTRAWLAQVRAVIGDDVDIMVVFAAGVKLLASFPLPPSTLRNDENDDGSVNEDGTIRHVVFAQQESNILNNRVTLKTVALGSAFFANATLLGIPIASLMDYEDAPVQPQALLCTKPDLVPTPAQLAIPHHPTVDVIPWPAFRSNVCIAIAHNPPLIDDDELCLDLMNDGVRCWGSAAGDSMHGRGQGAPWDQRSWEAAPWFLEKWKMLTDEDMWRNSEWWRAMHG